MRGFHGTEAIPDAAPSGMTRSDRSSYVFAYVASCLLSTALYGNTRGQDAVITSLFLVGAVGKSSGIFLEVAFFFLRSFVP